MGRLEDIIARNRNPKANRERIVVSIGFGVFILIILALMVFTDLGKSNAKPTEQYLDNVPMGAPKAPAKPAPPAK